MKKKEIIITIVIAIAGVILAGFTYFSRVKKTQNTAASSSASETQEDPDAVPSETPKGSWIAIIHRNHVAQWFDSGVDGEYDLTGDYGAFHVLVKDGKWCAHDVECPNHNCEQMGWDSVESPNLIPITCIPNNIVIVTADMAENYLETVQ